ncbi:mechanosensitive ion channel family protein [Polymorphobacter multimanifer]|uniref:mechanosensitive ion channel family protein n=1 Tax=Polymorphobacter multimanifer TaxID=1070431 RepID=UPI001FB19A43|nr:mechanosensitive ion channel domain-containing protein [Polymorphobacter multimanifer]
MFLISILRRMALAMVLAAPVVAQPTDGLPTIAPPAPVVESPLEARATAAEEAGNDRNTAQRMANIFGEIEGLHGVGIRVQSGVVTLTGTVTSQADRERAEAIAARFAGVVTVENAIDRTFEVDSNLSPVLEKFVDDLRRMARAVPLFGVALLIGLLIGGLGYLLAAQGRLWRWLAPNAFLAELFASTVRIVAIIAGLIVALQILGATALLGLVLGSAGVIGIALGFAVRDTVDNFVSSLMLSLRQPFRANDHVLIGESEGRVIRLTSRATILMTLDGNHLRIPNATVFKAIILNYSRNPQRRFAFDLGIDAADDPLRAMQVGLAAIRALPNVLDTPRSHAVIEMVGDSNIILRFFAWIDQRETDFGKGRSLAIQAAKQALEQSGFELPEPIYRIRVDAPGDASRLALAAARARPQGRPKSQASAPPTPASDEIEPDCAVEKLVTDERDEAREPDLLDTRRPIE